MIKHHDVIQGSDEWHELKKDKFSASNATAIGANGAGLITLCKKIVNNVLDIENEDRYTNSDMDRGVSQEPLARCAYEFEISEKVEEIGFITNDEYENSGISPDGLVLDVGGCEIKARNIEKHLSLILGETKEIPFNQIQMSLMITGRKWWDFVSFNPKHKKPIFIKRIYPDLKYFEKLNKGIERGNILVKEFLEKYNNYQPEVNNI